MAATGFLASEPQNFDERGRLAALRRYDILDTPPDGAFDSVAALAARLLGTPIATVSIVDEDRIWFKAKHGLDVAEIERYPGLCGSVVVCEDDSYLVTDAATDPRTMDNPLVTGELGVRFYAAAPLVTSDGYRLGTVNVIDTRPREITPEDQRTLRDLAALVVDQLELRLAARKLSQQRIAEQRLGVALQRNVLPPDLDIVPGVDIAACYRPMGEGLDISGDFYDLFESHDGTWIAAIGDVCGKGMSAAINMVGIHHRLRALAEVGFESNEVLRLMNEVIFRAGELETFCSLVYMQVRPGPERVVVNFSSGGHPLPMIRRVDGSVEEVGTPGVLIGAFPKVELEDVVATLEPGDLMLLYTDGVTERRGVDLLAREEQLRSALAERSEKSAEEVLAGLERAMFEDSTTMQDDAAMLVLRAQQPQSI